MSWTVEGGCIRGGWKLVHTPECGFFLVDCSESPIEDASIPYSVLITEASTQGMTVEVVAESSPEDAELVVRWGVGGASSPSTSGQRASYLYPVSGTYEISVHLASEPEVADRTSVTVSSDVPWEHSWAGMVDRWPTWESVDAPSWRDLASEDV